MKAIVLSSGGVDSTTCLAMAVHELGKENVVTLSFEYGQRHSKELDSAQKVADYYGVRHVVFNLTQIFSFSNCSLLSNSTEKSVHESYADQIAKNGEGKVSTYVPFRNGLMLSAGILMMLVSLRLNGVVLLILMKMVYFKVAICLSIQS